MRIERSPLWLMTLCVVGLLGCGGSGDACDSAPPADVEGPDCVTETLTCGSVVTGTTTGGTTAGTSAAYESWFCTPRFEDYDAPDRVYALDVAGGQDVRVDLTSRCADLDVFLVKWTDEASCPTESNIVSTCDADVASTGGTVEAYTANDTRYLVFVDGASGEEGAFRLQVSCTAH